MGHKQVLFRSEAREKILHGATALADAIRVTLGPKSKSVLIGIDEELGVPISETDYPKLGTLGLCRILSRTNLKEVLPQRRKERISIFATKTLNHFFLTGSSEQ